jgi:hypothetical protein
VIPDGLGNTEGKLHARATKLSSEPIQISLARFAPFNPHTLPQILIRPIFT